MTKKRIPGFLCGCLTTLTALALGTTVLAASGQVSFNFANVSLDGEQKFSAGSTITAANGQQVPSSILYTDAAGGKTNYLPIRAVSELLGVEIGYDSATKTVLLGKQPAESQARHWKRVVDGTSFSYVSQRPSTPYTTPPAWRPAWLPEGWKLSDVYGGSTQTSQRFSGESGTVKFICAYPDKGSIGSSVRHPETIQNCKQVTIQGYSADLYAEDGWVYLAWENQDGILFWFSGNGISVEDLIQMAQSVKPDTEKLPEYQLSWMPAGYVRQERSVQNAAVQEIWMKDGMALTWIYSGSAVEVPTGKPDAVTVGGQPGQFWAATEPYEAGDEEDHTASLNGVTITSGIVPGVHAKDVNTLAWTKDGVHFRLQSILDQAAMLRIAENVK